MFTTKILNKLEMSFLNQASQTSWFQANLENEEAKLLIYE